MPNEHNSQGKNRPPSVIGYNRIQSGKLSYSITHVQGKNLVLEAAPRELEREVGPGHPDLGLIGSPRFFPARLIPFNSLSGEFLLKIPRALEIFAFSEIFASLRFPGPEQLFTCDSSILPLRDSLRSSPQYLASAFLYIHHRIETYTKIYFSPRNLSSFMLVPRNTSRFTLCIISSPYKN